ncbi:MAG: T9SS type A sorting domain-containing protein [Pedobacter sp.]|uniref:T9SS type A sorting domain-containing protein n=1 Tax=Pedobacter sp. TaxID=1411316 RepID=UPI002809A310|nr:T9SS type A sorting domain-containing protein [Pedobacter sp.]MDQ8003604.1 T9SS type A sorting domain-containing protein [Pedobacter sp.]
MKIFTRIKFLLLSLFVIAGGSGVLAQVTSNLPNGGLNISNDLSTLGPSTAYTPLGDIVLQSTNATDFVTGTNVRIRLNAPTGWQFEASGVTVSHSGARITASNLVSISTTAVIIRYTAGTSTADNINTLRIIGLKVRSTTRTLGTTVNIIRASTTSNGDIIGFDMGATAAQMSKIPGAKAHLLALLPNQTLNSGSASGKSGTPTVPTAGIPFNVKVYATDYAYYPVLSTDQVSFTSNDPYAALPPNGNLENTLNGTDFPVTLNTAVISPAPASQTVTATNATNGSITASITTALRVNRGAFAKLLALYPGEVLEPGSPTGKTGTPDAPVAGFNYPVSIYSTDVSFNRVSSTNNVGISVTGVTNFTAVANGNMAAGARTVNLLFKVLGETPNVTAVNNTPGNSTISHNQILPAVVLGSFAKLQVLLPGESNDPSSPTGKSGSPTPQVAGNNFTGDITVLAVDDAWNPVTGISGDINLTSTDANATMPVNATMANGVATFAANTITLVTAGSRSFTVNLVGDFNKANTSSNVTVNPDAFSKLLITMPWQTFVAGVGNTGSMTPIASNTNFTIQVRSVDANFNVVTVSPTEPTVQLSTTDAYGTFTNNNLPLVNGFRSFTNARLRTAGTNTTITASTGDISKDDTTLPFTVTGGTYTKLLVILPGETYTPGVAVGKSGSPTQRAAGSTFNVEVRAVDAFSNTVDVSGLTINLTTTDPNVTIPDGLITNGVATFSNVALVTAGTRRFTATDALNSRTVNSANIIIDAAPFKKLLISLPGQTFVAGAGNTGSINPINVNTNFTITVRAVDEYFNVVSRTDDIQLSTNDALGTFQFNNLPLIAGVKSFTNARLRTAGTNLTITATKAGDPAENDTAGPITVVAVTYARLVLIMPGETYTQGIAAGKSGSPTTRIAGVPFDIKVRAIDAYGNIVPVNSTIRFTATNDIQAQLPPNTALVNGVLDINGITNYRLPGANRRLTATDQDVASRSSQSPAFTVNIGTFQKLLVILPGETYVAGHPNGKTGTPANQAQGVTFNAIVRATDSAFNTITTVGPSVTLASNEGFTTNASLTNGIKTDFAVTLNAFSYNPATTTLTATSAGVTPYTTAGIVVIGQSATNDFFRSVATGNWNNSSSWESSSNESNWQPSTLFPTTSSRGIVIGNGNTITITGTNATLGGSGVTLIESGAQLAIASGRTLTISNGAAAQDLVVTGTLRSAGTITRNTGSQIQVNSGGIYQHAFTTTSGTIPTANWATGSICEIVGYTTYAGDVAGSNQNFSDFVWNAPQTAAGLPSLLSGFNARNFTVTRTNSGTLNLGSVGGTTVITGNYLQTAGNVLANKTSGTQNISFGGDFAVNGGTFALGSGTVNVTYNGNSQSLSNAGTAIEFGNVTFSGGTKTLTSGSFAVATTGVLTMGSSTTLNANGNLTVLSDVSNSGTIATIPSGSSISGNVTVQRFVRGGAKDPFRTHRMFSSPIHTGSNTYNLAQLTDDILITGKSVNGFHEVGNSGTSAWFYDATSTGFKVFPSATTPVLAGRGVYVLYRGNTSNAAAKVASPYVDPENVVMDFSGTLNQQNVTVPLEYSATVSGFNLLGNPYASSINWDNVISSGATSDLENHVIQIWDPQARQYTTYDGDTPANGGSSIISSGQGFFVRSKAGGGSFTFRESHKSNSMAPVLLMTTPVRTEEVALTANGKIAAANNHQVASTLKTELRTWLKKENTPYKVESVVVFKDGKSADFVVGEDAPYLRGREVYMASLTSDNKPMVINYMPAIVANTSVKLYIDTMNASGNYKLEVNFNNVPSGYLVKLTDNYLHTSQFVSSGSEHSFNVDRTVAASFGDSRFSVSFEAPNTLPVTYNSFTVAKVNEGVQVKWSTATETDNDRFEVERAGDDKVFEKLQTVIAKGSGSAYSYIDRNPIIGNNYYRLVQYDKDSKNTTTDPQVVNFTGGLTNATELVSIFPNPVVSKFTVKFNGVLKANKQTLKIVSATGQVLLTKDFSKAQLLSGQDIDIASFASGVYIVEVYEGGTQRVGQMKLIKQ